MPEQDDKDAVQEDETNDVTQPDVLIDGESVEEDDVQKSLNDIENSETDKDTGNSEDDQSDKAVKEESGQQEGLHTVSKPRGKFAELLRTPRRKAVAGVLAVVVVAGVIFAIPASRYGIVGTFVKKDVTIVVSDAATKKPVSQAKVTLAGKLVSTNADGSAKFSQVPVGDYTVSVSKSYYKDATSNYTVPIFGDAQKGTVNFAATGRQVELSVVNKITREPLEKALVKVGDTSVETDPKGLATIVLPADKKTITGSIDVDGYNAAKIVTTVAEKSDANRFSVTPAGKIFYLSKITGKINVMSANLDGTDAKVVVEGTGKEKDNTTSQLAARDWSYVALQAHRDDDKRNQLYVINAKSGELKTVDAGDVDLQLVGWSGHNFIYEVIRSYDSTVDKRNALKSYNADTGKLTTLEESKMVNSYSESVSNAYIVEGKVIYTKGYTDWSILSVYPEGAGKKTLKTLQGTNYAYITGKAYEPGAVYYQFYTNGTSKYYEYEDGAVKDADISEDDFQNDYYPTYLLSPSDKKSFWYEPRDGKNTLFVGDGEGKNPKTIANLSEYSTYGWFGDDYILLSKNASELYIASASETLDKTPPLKVTDYHKPTLTYPGYGSGYGGL